MVKRKSRNKSRREIDRLSLLRGLLIIFAGFILFRLFNLQIIEHGVYAALADDQHRIYERLVPIRGEVYARDYNSEKLFPMALNENTYLLYANPKQITEPDEVVDQLEQILDIDTEAVLSRLRKVDDIYEPVAHNLTTEYKEYISNLGLEGLHFQIEPDRYYPEKNIGSHIIGFLGNDGENRIGQYGIEGYYKEELAGKYGELNIERDAGGNWITVGTTSIEEAQDGDDVVLTIDRNIQYQACQRLNEAVLRHGADGGSLIIINPKTGAIMAMCGSPDFDPNNYNEVENINLFLNPSTFYTYEPGSVFKPITMSAAIDLGVVTPQTTFVDEGQEVIGRYTIKNYENKVYGQQTMTQVLEESINTGAIFAARQVGDVLFEQYVKAYGFGLQTNIELESENGGDISTLNLHRDLYTSTASFGQGITVTPLQLVTAYGAIANGGTLMKPYIIDEIHKPNGAVIKTEPQSIRQVIQPSTARTISAMLVSVVQNGHGKRAGVPGYFVAGKTGTAQIPKESGAGYDENRTIGSFAGFAPATDPQFVMLAKIDVPRDVQAAESSAAPLFGEMAAWLVNYLNIPPSITVE
ncbi:peptidoglycan D,D-transpeptidase FtsI family protein [Patescibacteria group bacterium]